MATLYRQTNIRFLCANQSLYKYFKKNWPRVNILKNKITYKPNYRTVSTVEFAVDRLHT